MEKDLQSINSISENGEVIWFGYFDPNTSIFKTTQNSKATYSVAFCNNFENCSAYKRGLCALRNYNRYCPYGKIKKVMGPTRKAKSSFSFIRNAREKYEKEPHIKNLQSLDILCKIGSYVYIPLNFLDNYVNPIQGDLGINKKFAKLDNFDVDFIKKVYEYRPLAMFGGEIQSYQREEIPNFIVSLRTEFPSLFGKCLREIEGFDKHAENISFIGKKALIKTLAPGKIRVSASRVYDWDGEKIIADSLALSHFDGKEKVYIFPTDETVCQVEDNNTVEWGKTIFID